MYSTLYVISLLLAWHVRDDSHLKKLQRIAVKSLTEKSCRCKYCSSAQSSYTQDSYENVAFNKPTVQSTPRDAASTPGACSGVNGDGGNVYTPTSSSSSAASPPTPNCVATSPLDRPNFWQVDLQYPYTISEMAVSMTKEIGNQNDQSSSTYSALVMLQESGPMAGVQVLIEGHLCYTFPTTKTEDSVITFACHQPRTGRLVRLVQHTENQAFMFCELLIWVCKMGFYGTKKDGCRPCQSPCKYTCDNHYGCEERVLHNVALNKPVFVSSLMRGSGRFLTDGVPAQREGIMCVITDTDTAAGAATLHLVTVDMGQNYRVFAVNITARVDCCADQELRDFTILVTDKKNPDFEHSSDTLCASVSGALFTRETRAIQCEPTPRDGKFLHLRKLGAQALSLCELEVYGHRRYTLRTGSQCESNSETYVCAPKAKCEDGLCRIKPMEPCSTVSKQFCAKGTVCDDGKCKFALNATCDPSEENGCNFPLTCEGSPETCQTPQRRLHAPCSNDGECSSNDLCDFVTKTCRRKRRLHCSHWDDCVAGAFCFGITGKVAKLCSCDTHFGTNAGDKCLPKAGRVGSSCGTPGDVACKTTIPGITCQNNMCMCSQGYSVRLNEWGCEPPVGTACDNREKRCRRDLQCEDGKCKIKAGGNCTGKAEHCVKDTNCESNICKPKTGKKCTGFCVEGNMCRNERCYLLLGEPCSDDCYQGPCSQRDNNTCRLEAGSWCLDTATVIQSLCEARTLCEYDQECKKKIGGTCKDSNICLSNLVCVKAATNQPEGTCRMPLGAMHCLRDEDCVGQNTVCDTQHLCRLSKEAACAHQPEMCLTGASCIDNKCQCNQTVTHPLTDHCDPKPKEVLGSCNAQDSPPCHDDPHAICDQHGICQCESGYILNPPDLSCTIGVGLPCSGNGTSCLSGTSCINRLCVVDAGDRCCGNKWGHCKVGSTCDNCTCRLNLHQNCLGKEAFCKEGLVCDSNGRCKVNAGDACRSDRECMAGSACGENGTCHCVDGISTLQNGTCVILKGEVGGECEESRGGSTAGETGGNCLDPNAECHEEEQVCECNSNYTADSTQLKCGKDAGEPCTEDSECANPMVCDPYTNTCGIPLGEQCDGDKKRFCLTWLVCDFDFVCKLEVKADCSGENKAYCKNGFICDWFGECNIGVGDKCELSLDCIAGAVCVDSVCVCQQGFSVTRGAMCVPAPGGLGSNCPGGKCEMKGSVCRKGICRCALGYSPHPRQFKCISTGSKTSAVALLVGSIIAALLLFSCCGIFAFWHRRRTKKQIKKEVERRVASIVSLHEAPDGSSNVAGSGVSGVPESPAVSTTYASSGATASDVPQAWLTEDASDVSSVASSAFHSEGTSIAEGAFTSENPSIFAANVR